MSITDTAPTPVMKAPESESTIQWLDGIAFLINPTGLSIDSVAFGSAFRGWHEHDSADGETWLRSRCDGEDLYAKEKLGLRLIDGDGLKKDPSAGLACLREVAHAGSTSAMERLAAYLFTVDGSADTVAEAEHWLRKADKLGDESATIALAVRMMTSKTTTADARQGKALLTHLASRGNRLAHIKLAVALIAGWGGQENKAEGLSWLRRIGATRPDQVSSLGLYLYLRSLALPSYERRSWAEEAAVLFQEGIRQNYRDDELSLAYLLRRGEISGATYPTLGLLLASHLHDSHPLALINQALRFAKGMQCAVDWKAADRLVAKLADGDGILSWWAARSKEDDAEGHLVVGWLCRHQLAADPDKLSLGARMDLARRGGWAVPEWMNSFAAETPSLVS